MILSLVLYGSRARGDHRATSDVDLLGVVDGKLIRQEKAINGTSLYRYPVKLLLSNARKGDLFVLHLIKEGLVLHDTAEVFESIIRRFKFAASYQETAEEAALIIAYLTDRPKPLMSETPRKRLVWAIRTLIISKAAEEELAIFGSKALAEFSGIKTLAKIIDKRTSVSKDLLIQMARMVAQKYGMNASTLKWPKERRKQAMRMRSAGKIASKTLQMDTSTQGESPSEQSHSEY